MSPSNKNSSFPRQAILASLSASAAALVAGNAPASIITIPVNLTVGAGGISNHIFTQLPGAPFGIKSITSSSVSRLIDFVVPAHTIEFRFQSGAIVRTVAGKTYGQAGTGPAPNGKDFLASATTANQIRFSGQGNALALYTPFKFTANTGGTDYGFVTGTVNGTNFSSLSYTLDALTYDNTGVKIETGASPIVVPEPASLALLAMAIGAAAMRRRRAIKVVT